MAGLIEKEMMGQAEDPNAMEPGLMEGMESAAQEEPETGEAEGLNQDSDDMSENDPNFQTALQFAMEALYSNGGAKGVSESLKSAPERIGGLADTAYEIISIVDERTDGAVPDELLVLLATRLLEEVVDIGEAAGLDYKPMEVAEAFKLMILRFVQENGGDITELQAAMDQVDPQEIENAALAEG